MLSANTNFLYDGLNPVQELNGTTPTANLLTGGLDERFTRTDSTGTFDYLTDALGSTIALANSTGASQVEYNYDPYGNMDITGSSTNSYAYTGREFDGLGIDYYRARYYNPALGRFLSEDPIGFGGGPNLYSYTGDSPIQYSDPRGTDRCAPPPMEMFEMSNLMLNAMILPLDIADGDIFGAYNSALTILADEVLLSSQLNGNQTVQAANNEAAAILAWSSPYSMFAFMTTNSLTLTQAVAYAQNSKATLNNLSNISAGSNNTGEIMAVGAELLGGFVEGMDLTLDVACQ